MVAVASNIAEGSKRHTNPDYARFLNIAEGSVTEVEYLFILSRDLGYLAPEAAEPLITEAQEISRMLPRPTQQGRAGWRRPARNCQLSTVDCRLSTRGCAGRRRTRRRYPIRVRRRER
jgi:hypothetical protein